MRCKFARTIHPHEERQKVFDEAARDGRGPQELRSHLTSETGLVYTLLAHAAGRLG
ncbi:hypothetical protein IVA79_24220 [Bradyrhizobium sp. 138]|uniref:hypothetical protein n=1 Tax=Bradyrhizobium sp. 138 TaxID=2782615 RepID=UPI001FF8E7AD|nr:hypothetical protein [Bradyrhizobium sp. 138]MCK1736990.1 hypothetical protein [Bradyrhizobium sp. 138]